MAKEEDANKIARSLEEILEKAAECQKQNVNTPLNTVFDPGADDGWVTVVTENQMAICHDGTSHINEEVIVQGYLYTPHGIRYRLMHPRDGVQWQVTANIIHPIHGITQLEQYNVNTGEVRSIPAQRTST